MQSNIEGEEAHQLISLLAPGDMKFPGLHYQRFQIILITIAINSVKLPIY